MENKSVDYNNTLIIPACGESSRYPGMRPKWLLTHPVSGLPMFLESIKGLDVTDVNRIVLVALKKHEEQYGFIRKVTDIMNKIYDKKFDVLLLDKSENQPSTIAQAIEQLEIKGQIHCKDTDNYFRCSLPFNKNYVGICSLNNVELINACNKSYAEFNVHNKLINIVEKNVISNTFCTGLYGFADAKYFLDTFTTFRASNNFYVSHVILFMMLMQDFDIHHVKDYLDWGTSTEWLKYRDNFKTYFVDLDGVLVRSSAEYMTPYWGTTEPISKNVKAINDLYLAGNKIIITTGRTREYLEKTYWQLRRAGLLFHDVIFDCGHGARVIINDFAPSNPHPSCEAINLKRNEDYLGELL